MRKNCYKEAKKARIGVNGEKGALCDCMDGG